MNPVDDLPDLLVRAGLTGRGGAAFSTARKIRSALENDAQLLVNVCDGEIGAAKDGWIVHHHLRELLDGAALLAGSTTPVFAAHRGSVTHRMLSRAGVDVLQVPGRYVSSEETALVNLLHGGLARPIAKTRPISAGDIAPDGRVLAPTLVLNAETVWRVAQIVRHGATWFRGYGTADEPGPRLVSVSAVGGLPVVLETEAGERIDSVLARAGVPCEGPGINIGGLSGGFITSAERPRMRWSAADLAPYGLAVGSGVIRVLAPAECPWPHIAELVRYAAGESAGQCGPCMFGLPAVADDVELLVAGRGDRRVLDRLRQRLRLLPGRGACHHPNGVSRFTASALRCFEAELQAHVVGECGMDGTDAAALPIRAGRLPARRSAALMDGSR